jgi:hypothetical protein
VHSMTFYFLFVLDFYSLDTTKLDSWNVLIESDLQVLYQLKIDTYRV